MAVSIDQKPCFETSDKKVFLNLHNAAAEKAAEKCQIKSDPNLINSIVVNTAISEDGRSMASKKIDPANNNALEKLFGKNNREYEVGIILQFTDFKSVNTADLTSTKEKLEKIHEENKDGLEKLKAKITEGLREYFRWFAGEDQIPEPVEFIPDYNGEHLVLKNYAIEGMDEDKLEEYFANHSDKQKPRIGYKVGYTISYNK